MKLEAKRQKQRTQNNSLLIIDNPAAEYDMTQMTNVLPTSSMSTKTDHRKANVIVFEYGDDLSNPKKAIGLKRKIIDTPS